VAVIKLIKTFVFAGALVGATSALAVAPAPVYVQFSGAAKGALYRRTRRNIRARTSVSW